MLDGGPLYLQTLAELARSPATLALPDEAADLLLLGLRHQALRLCKRGNPPKRHGGLPIPRCPLVARELLAAGDLNIDTGAQPRREPNLRSHEPEGTP